MSSGDEATIRGLVESWIRATIEGDIAAVTAMMADDVVFLVPGREPFGKDAFVDSSKLLKGMHVEASGAVQEIVIAGDFAYAITHLDLTFTTQKRVTTRRAGHSLTIYRKESDGRWLLARDANLMTAPGKPPPA